MLLFLVPQLVQAIQQTQQRKTYSEFYYMNSQNYVFFHLKFGFSFKVKYIEMLQMQLYLKLLAKVVFEI